MIAGVSKKKQTPGITTESHTHTNRYITISNICSLYLSLQIGLEPQQCSLTQDEPPVNNTTNGMEGARALSLSEALAALNRKSHREDTTRRGAAKLSVLWDGFYTATLVYQETFTSTHIYSHTEYRLVGHAGD